MFGSVGSRDAVKFLLENFSLYNFNVITNVLN